MTREALAFRLPAGAVVLAGEALDAVCYAVGVAQEARVRNGLPRSRGLDQLAAIVAAPGHPDSPEADLGEADRMTTTEAAQMLGCSARTVRRLAPGLGGRQCGGQWFVDRQAVTEHAAEGRHR